MKLLISEETYQETKTYEEVNGNPDSSAPTSATHSPTFRNSIALTVTANMKVSPENKPLINSRPLNKAKAATHHAVLESEIDAAQRGHTDLLSTDKITFTLTAELGQKKKWQSLLHGRKVLGDKQGELSKTGAESAEYRF